MGLGWMQSDTKQSFSLSDPAVLVPNVVCLGGWPDTGRV